jgi:hypothetical protein
MLQYLFQRCWTTVFTSNDDHCVHCRRIRRDTVHFLEVYRYFTYYETQWMSFPCWSLKFLWLLLSFFIFIEKILRVKFKGNTSYISPFVNVINDA